MGEQTATEFLWIGAEARVRKSLPKGPCDRRTWVTTKVGQGWLNISSRTGEKSPPHDMTIIQSVSYRDRSLSRGRTHMDLEDPNGVSEGDIGLPTPLTEFQRWYYWFGKFLWLDMSLKSLDSRGHAVPWVGSVCPEITTSRYSNQDFILEFPFRISLQDIF